MLSRIADRLILQPSRHSIPAEGKRRLEFDFSEGRFEVWTQRVGDNQPREADSDLFIVKFPGAGGRAERMSEHPADAWTDLTSEVWTVNPPGYGGSGGRASLRHMTAVADTVIRELTRRAAGKPILATGNSLGCLSAFYLGAYHPVAGLLIRNPPPLRQLIAGHHAWWNFGLSKWIAAQVPEGLCCVENAARSEKPAVFVSSEQDRTVPLDYQRQIFDAYGGEKRQLLLRDADHATPIDDGQRQDYLDLLAWLRQRIFAV